MTLESTTRASEQERLYETAIAEVGDAIDRLARSYEADPHRREDLLQEIHLALWRSLTAFDGRCSMRTWVFRVGHNVGASHILKQKRAAARLVSLDAVPEIASDGAENVAERRMMLQRMYELIHHLKPLDRQIVLLYLEGSDARTIGEITGLTPGNIATKISRLKRVLGERAATGASHA